MDSEEEVSRIRDLAQSLDISDGVVRIFRQAPGRSEYDYEGAMPVDTFSLEELKRLYGGGKYQLKLASRTGKYIRSLKTSVHPRHVGEVYKEPEKPVTSTPTSPQAPNDLMMMLITSAQAQATQAREMAQQQAREAQAQQQMLLTLMLTNQKSSTEILVAALSGRTPGQSGGGGNEKMIELLTPMLIENMKPRGGLTETIATVKALQELSAPAAPATTEPKEEDMIDKLSKLAGVVGPIAGAFMQRNAPQPQPMSVGPMTRANPEIPGPSQEEAAIHARVQNLLGQLRFATPLLIKSAKSNQPVEDLVGMLDSFINDEEYEMLCQLLERDSWVAELFGNHPEVIANLPWFASLREVILNPEGDEAPTDSTEATPQGPTANPSSPLTPV